MANLASIHKRSEARQFTADVDISFTLAYELLYDSQAIVLASYMQRVVDVVEEIVR